jgi:hypothetical protein
MTNLQVQLKPGPKVLAAALKLAGFSETSYYPVVKDAAGVTWKPSGLQIALALCGGEASGNAWAYHRNLDSSVDYGILEINGVAHKQYFGQYSSVNPTAWNWMNYLDNAKAAYAIHAASNYSWSAWNAYTGGGYLSVRYQGRTWMDWAAHGVSTMLAAVASLVAEGVNETTALAQVASVNNDPLVYW